MNFKAIILAGGQSRRFGRNKALECLDGIPIIQMITNLLKSLELEVTVVQNDQQDYTFLGVPVLSDEVDDKGPLGGLYTAMKAYSENLLLVVTCDMPFLNQDAISHLMTYYKDEQRLMVYKAGQAEHDRIQPFPGIYSAVLIEQMRQHLEANKLSMRCFIQEIQNKIILPWKWPVRHLKNINYQEDLGEIDSTELIRLKF